jgi:hypothetical protein
MYININTRYNYNHQEIEMSLVLSGRIESTSRVQIVNFMNLKIKIYYKIKLKAMSYKEMFLIMQVDLTRKIKKQ